MKRRKEKIIMKKYCVKCGKQFEATGREVICPSCKQAAAEDAKRAAVLKAKRASWAGESVPVRISGRASTVIREYGAVNGMPFAAALDDLLKASAFFLCRHKTWEEVEPYKSHRRVLVTAENEQEVKQDGTQEVTKAAGKPQEVTKAAKVANKNTTSKPQEAPQASKQAAKTTSKTSTAKKAIKTTAGKKA